MRLSYRVKVSFTDIVYDETCKPLPSTSKPGTNDYYMRFGCDGTSGKPTVATFSSAPQARTAVYLNAKTQCH